MMLMMMYLVLQAANIVSRDMLKMNNQFNGSFESNCQESVPASLLALVAMVLNGTNIKAQSDSATPQPVLTISQLLMFNSLVRRRKKDSQEWHGFGLGLSSVLTSSNLLTFPKSHQTRVCAWE